MRRAAKRAQFKHCFFSCEHWRFEYLSPTWFQLATTVRIIWLRSSIALVNIDYFIILHTNRWTSFISGATRYRTLSFAWIFFLLNLVFIVLQTWYTQDTNDQPLWTFSQNRNKETYCVVQFRNSNRFAWIMCVRRENEVVESEKKI